MVTHNTGAGRWNTSGQRNNSLPQSHRKHTSGFLKPAQIFTPNCSPAFALSVASLPAPRATGRAAACPSPISAFPPCRFPEVLPLPAGAVGSLRQHLPLPLTALDPIFQLAMDCQTLVTPEVCTWRSDLPLMDLHFCTNVLLTLAEQITVLWGICVVIQLVMKSRVRVKNHHGRLLLYDHNKHVAPLGWEVTNLF